MSKDAMLVAGVMSGTSADGINVALVRIGRGQSSRSPRSSAPRGLRIQLLGHTEHAYPAKVRAAILAAMNSESASVADLARLNFLLGELYADAVLAAQRQLRVKAELIGATGKRFTIKGKRGNF